jgi:hypothetical protein
MGIFSDTYDEFKKASPAEKIFIVGGGAAVIAIALYIRSKGGQPTPAQGPTGATLQGAGGGIGGGGIQTVPGPNAGQYPILPPGLTPIFGPDGGLLGYQPIQQGGILAPGPSGGVNPPSPPPGVAGITYPLIPSGQYKGPSFSNLKAGTYYTYGGVKYLLSTGSSGRLYGTEQKGGGSTVLLYGPPSAYGSFAPKQGGGPYGTRVLSVHGARIAPSRELLRPQMNTATRLYAMHSRRV